MKKIIKYLLIIFVLAGGIFYLLFFSPWRVVYFPFARLYSRIYLKTVNKLDLIEKTIEKTIEKDCQVSLQHDSKEKIALALTDFVFKTTQRGAGDLFLTGMHKFILAHSRPPVVQTRGESARELSSLLKKMNIESHVIVIAAESYFEREKEVEDQRLDTQSPDMHVVAEVSLSNKWVVLDPTFNCSYACSNGEKMLSLEEMSACVKSGYELIAQEGKSRIEGYSLKEYPWELKKLMFAYKILNTQGALLQDWIFLE